MLRSRLSAMLGAAVAACGLSSAAGAASIAVNFVGGGGPNSGSSLAPSDAAGLVVQDEWNNAPGASGSLMGLLNDAGNSTSASISWTSPNTWSSGTDTSTPNGRLLNGYIDSGGSAATGAMLTVTGVPYPAYDVIVYFNTDSGTPRVGDYELTTSGTSTQQVSYEKSSLLVLAPPYLDDSVPTTASTPAGTFTLFPFLTGSSFTLKTDQASLPNVNFRAPISGIQIYGVPEPGSLGVLTVLGGLALARSRRKPADSSLREL